MVYYNYDMAKWMKGTKYDETLQKYFPDNDKWGACAYFDSQKNFEFVEICTLTKITTNKTKWTHLATIAKCDDGTFEVFSQFNGKNENELWVFGDYKRFKGACHCVASKTFQDKTRKPIKIFE